jgi:hypothetical protein
MADFEVYREDIGLPGKLPQFQVSNTATNHGYVDERTPRLCPPCVTPEEVDYYVDHLIQSLEKVRDAAKGVLEENSGQID